MATVLKRGSKGAAVREIQELLNAAGATPQLDVDGNFGGGTENAVRAFQRSFGLVGDGKVGPQTRTALKQATTPTKPGKPEPDKSAMNQAASSAAVVGTRGSPPPNIALSQAARYGPPDHGDHLALHGNAGGQGLHG